MKLTRGTSVFFALGLAAYAGSSYSIRLSQPTQVGGAELKAGDYRVQVEGGKAIIKGEGKTIETNVRVEDGAAKFSRTSVRYDTADGKYKMEQIQIGGTKTTLVFGDSESGAKAAQPAGVR
ncbi:MAG TPA: hypothetical protein VKV74_07255 [Bryobacteraceae bacterium]|nr:hypothetical protein [Bryobacteraceae bacterium]